MRATDTHTIIVMRPRLFEEFAIALEAGQHHKEALVQAAQLASSDRVLQRPHSVAVAMCTMCDEAQDYFESSDRFKAGRLVRSLSLLSRVSQVVVTYSNTDFSFDHYVSLSDQRPFRNKTAVNSNYLKQLYDAAVVRAATEAAVSAGIYKGGKHISLTVSIKDLLFTRSNMKIKNKTRGLSDGGFRPTVNLVMRTKDNESLGLFRLVDVDIWQSVVVPMMLRSNTYRKFKLMLTGNADADITAEASVLGFSKLTATQRAELFPENRFAAVVARTPAQARWSSPRGPIGFVDVNYSDISITGQVAKITKRLFWGPTVALKSCNIDISYMQEQMKSEVSLDFFD